MAYLKVRLAHLPNVFANQVTIFWAIRLMFVMFNLSRSISSLDPIITKSWAPSFSLQIFSLHHCCYCLTRFCSFLAVNRIRPTLSSCTHSLSYSGRVSFLSSTSCLSASFVACYALCTCLVYGPCRKCPTHCWANHAFLNTMHTTPYKHRPTGSLFNQLWNSLVVEITIKEYWWNNASYNPLQSQNR
jgi:hypothetical protein